MHLHGLFFRFENEVHLQLRQMSILQGGKKREKSGLRNGKRGPLVRDDAVAFQKASIFEQIIVRNDFSLPI